MVVDPTLLTPAGADGRVRILHVDDEQGQTQLTKTYLERLHESFDVVTAGSASEAMDEVDLSDIDCIVSDYKMPGMDGLDFLQAVREHHPDLPFVLFTGKGSEEIASRAISAGVTDYLRKGSGSDRYEVLANRIENLVNGFRDARSLGRAEDLFTSLFEARSEALLVVDATGQYVLAANAQVAALLGHDPDEIVGELPAESCFGAELGAFLATALEQPRTRAEFACRAADGGLVPVEGIATWLPVGDREVLLLSLRDVTERKARELERKAVQSAVEHAGHSIYRTDPDGTIIDVNPAFEEITGYDRSVAVGATPAILKSGVHDEAFYEELWETILSGEVWRSHIVNERADGERYVVDQTIAPVEQDGEIREFVAVNAELPDVEVEEGIGDNWSSERTALRSQVSPSPVAMLLAEADTGSIVAANEAAGDLFECSPATLEELHQRELHPDGERYREVFRDHQAEAHESVRNRAWRARLPDGSPVEIRTANGDRRRVAIVASPTEIDDTAYFLGAFIDLERLGTAPLTP